MSRALDSPRPGPVCPAGHCTPQTCVPPHAQRLGVHGRERPWAGAGLPTHITRQVLPRIHDVATLRPCPAVLTSLRDQLGLFDQRAAELETARREHMTDTIQAVAGLLSHQQTAVRTTGEQM
ncbi:hypothetical protein ABH940_003577 [Streptacidiphilus sp. BW17]|uniref:hypothetical protein n=1 Tax=Streptacidiphilus sp. BW17 TaxID=3156274 RepID=UPI0035114226